MLGGDCGKRMIDVGHGKYCTQVSYDLIRSTMEVTLMGYGNTIR